MKKTPASKPRKIREMASEYRFDYKKAKDFYTIGYNQVMCQSQEILEKLSNADATNRIIHSIKNKHICNYI